ncbi:uncharacterized protein LOC141854322 [Brevipalpus obovatus]|uniref:uncharacterized protein LOC141854322 n=1 Tax=Brevipalpus obovatus TaxID=246614 RepID=UPI003D9E9AFD
MSDWEYGRRRPRRKDRYWRIEASHRKGMSMSKLIVEGSDSDGRYWLIQSATGDPTVYVMKENNPDCSCNFWCEDCRMCFHHMLCSCPDYFENENICKHLHYWKEVHTYRTRHLVVMNSNDMDENVRYLVAQNSLIDTRRESGKRLSETIEKLFQKSISTEECQSLEGKIAHFLESLTNSLTPIPSSQILVKKEIKKEDEGFPSPKKIKMEPTLDISTDPS